MNLSPRATSSAVLSLSLSLFVAGCGVSTFNSVSSSPTALPLIKGNVHGGQQPVSGATVQLYAANTSTNQGASTPMLTSPVTTASNGGFSITGDYTCPASNPLVYIVATGGNPGLPGNVNNNALAMMSLLGTCNALLSGASSTYVYIDELTTVASVQAAASFMTDYAHIGAAPSNPTALAGVFQNATALLNLSTGQFQGTAASVNLPETIMNTLSDIISVCVNSSGATSGDGTPCGNMLSYTGSASDTVTATLHMTQSPGHNTAQLYNLIPSTPPFQPYFTSVPSDFTSTVGFTVPASIEAGALDSLGRLWLYTGGYSYNTVTDTSTDNVGVVTVYDNNFNQLFTISPGTGGLFYPVAMAGDASGHVFAVNANNTISEFSSNGSPISPSGGWSTNIATTFSPSGSGNNYITGSSQVDAIQIDALGNIWGPVPYGSSPGNCYFEMNSSGTVITPAGNFCTATGITEADTSITDGMGNAWALGTSTIAKVNAAGALAATAPVSQGCFYPDSNLTGSGSISLQEESITLDLLYDHVNNHVWGYSQTGAGAITDAGVAVFCDMGATTLPVLPLYASTSTTPGSAYSGGSLVITSTTLDGAGNLWFVSGGVALSGVVGTSSGTFTGTATYSAYLGEIGSNGTLLSPYNAGTHVYGLQPAGLGTNAVASATNASVHASAGSASLLGVDLYGNIWADDAETGRLFKITGLATANTVNY